jgi:hypothetical protein
MKPTIQVVAALLLLSASAASASPVAGTTDEARAMAGLVLPHDEPATAAAPPARFPPTTDEARALAHRSLPGSSPQVLIGAEHGLTTDQARALAGGAVRGPAPVNGSTNVACPQACACRHGEPSGHARREARAYLALKSSERTP